MCDGPLLRVPPALIVEKKTSIAFTSKLDAALHGSEQHMIEHALAEAQGRVSGPSGAAARLGVPASTLESKIKRFNIDKLRFRAMRRDAAN
jgi:transcriptional regulator with GAF, ATPase, and Fis domain